MATKKKANVVTPDPDNLGLGGDIGAHGSTLGGPPRDVPPIFESYIYPYIKPVDDGLGGDLGSHGGTLGGPPADRDPLFVMYTFQFTPRKPKPPSIEGHGKEGQK